jgi:anti-sigma factor RsiW
MTCRRVARELIERFRFGPLDRRSAPHLEHLETCARCREEVGLDRAFVLQLQRALRQRIEGAEPPPSSWSLVRARAIAESSEQLGWRARLLGFGEALRVAGAGAVVALVIVLSRAQVDVPHNLPSASTLGQMGHVEVASFVPVGGIIWPIGDPYEPPTPVGPATGLTRFAQPISLVVLPEPLDPRAGMMR